MTTISEMKLRQHLIEIQKKEKLNTTEIIELLDRQKDYFMLLREKNNREW
jgi:hypothetical protein